MREIIAVNQKIQFRIMFKKESSMSAIWIYLNREIIPP